MFTAAFVATAVSAAAPGAVVPTDAFNATAYESFDTLESSRSQPMSIFDGAATVDADSGSLIHTTSWMFYGRGHTMPNSGSHFIGAPSAPITYEFSKPIFGFAGFFSTNSDIPGGTIEFFDAMGALIDSAPLDVPADDNEGGTTRWAFNTFTSSAPVSSVRVLGNYSGGGFVMHDDIRISTQPIPSPGATAALVLAGSVIIRRRRSA